MTGWRIEVAARLWAQRWLLAILCGVAGLLSLLPLAQLTVSNSLEIWYPDGDPVLADYREFVDRYGSDELVVVAVSDPGGFRSDGALERVASLTDDLYGIAGVADVISISTVPESMLGLRGRLLDDDARTTALLVRMEAGPGLEEQRHAVLLRLEQAAARSGMPARMAGFGVIYDTLNQASTEGASVLIGAAHLLMLGLLWALYGRLGPTITTLAAVALAAIWTMGAYSAFGEQLNMVTMVLPTLVLVIGIADCSHLLRSVAREPRGGSREDRVIRGIARALGPCLLTSVTTAAGFLALALSDLPIVRGLGSFGALGVMAALVTSVCITIAALSFEKAEPASGPEPLDRIPLSAWRLAARYPGAVLGLFALLTAVSVIGITRIDVDTYSIGYLADDHPVRRDSDLIEATLGAYASIDFVVDADDVFRADVLRSLAAWQSAAERHPAVDWSWSLLDATGMRSESADYERVAGETTRLGILAPELRNSLVDGRRQLRVSFGAPMMSARDVQSLVNDLKSEARFPAEVRLEPAGYAAAYTRIIDRLVTAQRDGFAASFVFVFACIGLALRSRRRLALAVPANLVPVAGTLGLMGFAGIPLDIATVTIASVLLGLIVDDTVHMVWPRGGDGLRDAMARTVAHSGGTLVMTSVVLGAGFLVFGLADIRSVAWFGRLAAFTVVTALATDLLLLPAMAAVLDRRPAPAGDPSRVSGTTD